MGLPPPLRRGRPTHSCSRARAFVWDGLDRDEHQGHPADDDAFSPKNQELDAGDGRMPSCGVARDPPGAIPRRRRRSSAGTAPRRVEPRDRSKTATARPRARSRPGSRWDRLKDPVGGPEASRSTSPDQPRAPRPSRARRRGGGRRPRGARGAGRGERRHSSIPGPPRPRPPPSLPMDDLEENAAMVNALQRRADVVVQKSLAEGFGLTVAEAMWKARPVVASRHRRNSGPDRRRRERHAGRRPS